MNALVAFNFEGQGVVRVVDRDGNPWFVLADVCKVLGLGNPSAVAARLDPDEKDTLISNEGIRSGPGNPNVTLINESGLHALVMSSRKPAAKRFRKWVTSEVIPSVLRTGSYGVQRDLNDPRVLRQQLLGYTERVIALQEEVAVLTPKAAALARLEAAAGAMCLTDAAKVLGLKRDVLIGKLKAMRWIYRRHDGGSWVAFQPALNAGRLEHRTHMVTRSNGEQTVHDQVMVTAKGLAHLAKRLAGATVDAEDRADAPHDGADRLVTA